MKDERITQIEEEKAKALANVDNVYSGLLADNDALLNKQNDFANRQLEAQNEILDKQLNFNLEEINKQKEETNKSYKDELIRSSNDYQKFINPYGANAEYLANNGLQNSGYAETTKLGAYNVWQNRNSQAKVSYDKAIQMYDTEMNQARMTNDITKAQNALNKLKLEMDNISNHFSNKSNYLQTQLNTKSTLDNDYYSRITNAYNQLMEEKQFEEAKRQFDESQKLQQAQFEEQKRQWEKSYQLSKKTSGGGSSKLLLGNDNSKTEFDETIQIKTKYWSGGRNYDCENGTFKTKDQNGVEYQPDNIEGVKLTSTGKKVSEVAGRKGVVNTRGVNIDNQTVWKIGNTNYIWNGTNNKYEIFEP